MILAGRVIVLIGLLVLAGCAAGSTAQTPFSGSYGGINGSVSAGRS